MMPAFIISFVINNSGKSLWRHLEVSFGRAGANREEREVLSKQWEGLLGGSNGDWLLWRVKNPICIHTESEALFRPEWCDHKWTALHSHLVLKCVSMCLEWPRVIGSHFPALYANKHQAEWKTSEQRSASRVPQTPEAPLNPPSERSLLHHNAVQRILILRFVGYHSNRKIMHTFVHISTFTTGELAPV